MLKNKRRLKRHHLILYLRVFNEINNELIGYAVNITTRGIMITSEHLIEIDRLFHLKMLVESWDNRQTFIHFDALSRWSQQSVNTDFYDTGFELKNVNANSFKKIKIIINELGFSNCPED